MYSVHGTACAVGFPIRTCSDQCLLPAPRAFSQAATSFIASDRQGIHRVRLFAYHITAKFLGYMATNKPTTLRFKSFRTRLSLTTHFDKISSKTLATSTLSKNEHQAS